MHEFPYGMFFGGVGLFLIGMMLMTDGLKAASGPTLVKFLEKTTNTRLKGFLSGFIATTILQVISRHNPPGNRVYQCGNSHFCELTLASFWSECRNKYDRLVCCTRRPQN